jgi:hypothetical protein
MEEENKNKENSQNTDIDRKLNPKEKNQISCTDLISKNTSLRSLYLIGFNTKPANKAVVNSIDFSDAIEKIKNFVESKKDEITMRCYGNLILGLSKYLNKNLKIFYEELDNLLKINKEKGQKKLEKQNEENIQIEKNKNKNKENIEINTINTSTKFPKAKKDEQISHLDKYTELINGNNFSLNNSTKDITMGLGLGGDIRNITNRSNINFNQISNINLESSSFFSKFDINKIEEETPSKIGMSSKKSFLSDDRIDMMRQSMNNINNISGNKANFNIFSSNSLIFSGNKFISNLVEKSNYEDEVFKREIDFNFLNTPKYDDDKFDNLKLNEIINEGHIFPFMGNDEFGFQNNDNNIDIDLDVDVDADVGKEDFMKNKIKKNVLDDLNLKLEKEMQDKFLENIKDLKGRKKKRIFKNKKIENLIDKNINEEFEIIRNLKLNKNQTKKIIEEKYKILLEENLNILDKVRKK